jgi:putative ATPase
MADVRAGRVGQVPVHLRDAHYPGAKGHGVTGYVYPHDQPGAVFAQQYAPDPVVGRTYYEPTDRGAEERITDLVARLRGLLRPGAEDLT